MASKKPPQALLLGLEGFRVYRAGWRKHGLAASSDPGPGSTIQDMSRTGVRTSVPTCGKDRPCGTCFQGTTGLRVCWCFWVIVEAIADFKVLPVVFI